mmetsp:Transcript_14936/g.64016  ORF Transcript_14936/g.64016 Transcript_14936/m.64016 type:complete len:264 (+) Transcript_14936:555-1346(+)
MARSTASAISTLSSPMYSLEVPLNGILVDTMETNTPILSLFLSILYEPQFNRCTHRVTTSEPPSNKSGMRLAKRNTLCPAFTSLPPSETHASTMSGCPPHASAGPTKDAIQSGPSSFMIPKRKLYSPAGDKHSPLGSAKRAYDSNCCTRVACVSVTSRGAVVCSNPFPSSATSRAACSLPMDVNSLCRKFTSVFSLVWLNSVLTSSWSSFAALGWCLVVSGGDGITSVRRRNIASTFPRASDAAETYLKWNCAYGVTMASCRR